MSDLLTVDEVAAILKVSPDTVMRRFAKIKGVIDLGSPETPKRRRYRVLRIPRIVVEKFLLQRGSNVPIEIPPAKPTPRVPKQLSANWEEESVRDLAKAVSQHGIRARQTLDRIARQARTLTFVPEEQWEDVVFIDDEDQ